MRLTILILILVLRSRLLGVWNYTLYLNLLLFILLSCIISKTWSYFLFRLLIPIIGQSRYHYLERFLLPNLLFILFPWLWLKLWGDLPIKIKLISKMLPTFFHEQDSEFMSESLVVWFLIIFDFFRVSQKFAKLFYQK